VGGTENVIILWGGGITKEGKKQNFLRLVGEKKRGGK